MPGSKNLNDLIIQADEALNNKQFKSAYTLYQNALKEIEVLKNNKKQNISLNMQEFNCQLSTVECSIQAYALTPIKALTKIKALKTNLDAFKKQEEFYKKSLEIIKIYLRQLNDKKFLASYWHDYAVNLTTFVDKIASNDNDNKISHTLITKNQEAIQAFENAKNLFLEENEEKDANDVRDVLADTYENFADSLCDIAEDTDLIESKKIHYLLLANEHYLNAINNLRAAHKSISIDLYLSQLNTYDELSKLDDRNKEKYLSSMRQLIIDENLDAMIDDIIDLAEKADKLEDLEANKKACSFDQHQKKKRTLEKASPLPAKKQKPTSTHAKVLASVAESLEDEFETITLIPPSVMSSEELKEDIFEEIALLPPSVTPNENNSQELPINPPSLNTNKLFFSNAIKNFVKNNQQIINSFHMSELLRVIAHYHAQCDGNPFAAVVTNNCYMRAIALEQKSKTAWNELQDYAQTNAYLAHYPQFDYFLTINEWSEAVKISGHLNFFEQSIENYINEIEENYPKKSERIFKYVLADVAKFIEEVMLGEARNNPEEIVRPLFRG